MAAYPLDLRKRVVRAYDRGVAPAAVAAQFEVSLAWVHRLVQRRRETGSIAPRKQTNSATGSVGGPEVRRPRSLLAPRPDATLTELRDALPTRRQSARSGGPSTNWDSPSKKTVHADEQRRPDVVAERRRWRGWQPLRDVRQYVFLDECGVTTDLLRRYGRSPRGLRLRDHTPCGHWETHTVVAGLRFEGLAQPPCSTARSTMRRSPPMSSKSSCPRYSSAMWWSSTISRRINSPTSMRPIESPGAHLRFLPPYSSDFNPIELAFAKLKAFLRAARPRRFDQVCALVLPRSGCLSLPSVLTTCGTADIGSLHVMKNALGGSYGIRGKSCSFRL